MTPPFEPARPGSPHTAVKHELLVRYLDVWTPTVLHSARRVCYAEGYAGAGLQIGREDGSPGAALRVFAEFTDRLAGHELVMVLVEDDQRAVSVLTDRLGAAHTELGSPAELTVHTIRGSCDEALVPALTEARTLTGPVLAYLDAAGASPPPFQTVAAIARHRSSEVLLILDPAQLRQLATAAGPRENGDDVFGDRIFGDRGWRGVAGQPIEQRYPSLVTRYRESLHRAGLSAVVHAELVDDAGAAQLLFFASRSAKNLEKFKTELWAVDEYAGVRYRDPRDSEQELIDISFSPSLGPLRRSLLDTVTADGPRTVADLRQHTLAETMYRGAEATRALGAMLTAGSLSRHPERGRLAADTVLAPAGRGGG